jgi:hypothetical protein
MLASKGPKKSQFRLYKLDINKYLCGVNKEVRFSLLQYNFHRVPALACQPFFHQFFISNDKFHQTTGCIITG